MEVKKPIICGIILIILAPIVVNVILCIPSFVPVVGSPKNWLSFFGGFIGSVISATVALFILYEQKNDNDTQNRLNRNLQIALFLRQSEARDYEVLKECSSRLFTLLKDSNLKLHFEHDDSARFKEHIDSSLGSLLKISGVLSKDEAIQCGDLQKSIESLLTDLVYVKEGKLPNSREGLLSFAKSVDTSKTMSRAIHEYNTRVVLGPSIVDKVVFPSPTVIAKEIGKQLLSDNNRACNNYCSILETILNNRKDKLIQNLE